VIVRAVVTAQAQAIDLAEVIAQAPEPVIAHAVVTAQAVPEPVTAHEVAAQVTDLEAVVLPEIVPVGAALVIAQAAQAEAAVIALAAAMLDAVPVAERAPSAAAPVALTEAARAAVAVVAHQASAAPAAAACQEAVVVVQEEAAAAAGGSENETCTLDGTIWSAISVVACEACGESVHSRDCWTPDTACHSGACCARANSDQNGFGFSLNSQNFRNTARSSQRPH
jgi:hypothetical protein